MHADIGAAVDGHDAVAVKAMPRLDQLQRELNLDRIEAAGFEHLEADTDPTSALAGPTHAVVKAVMIIVRDWRRRAQKRACVRHCA